MRQKNIFIHTKELEHAGKLLLVGRVLRQIYLDELPQLWNVIKGEMSLVGPRPLNEEVYRNETAVRLPTQAFLPAGITGLFQSYKGTGGVTAAQLDDEYARQFVDKSGLGLVWVDIKIIGHTVGVVLKAKGI